MFGDGRGGAGGGGGVREAGEATAIHGEDEYSPSASTISTKASLAVAKTKSHHHAGVSIGFENGDDRPERRGMGQGGIENPPIPNMVSDITIFRQCMLIFFERILNDQKISIL